MQTSDRGRPRWPLVLLATALVASIALAWWPAFDAPYQYDDYVTPLKDPASSSLTSWLQTVPQTLRPLTKLSFALESSLHMTSAPARRVLQAVFFLGTVAALAMLARRAGLSTPAALALSTLWAVHPVHTETVIALAGRSVLLALLLTLLSALCLLEQRPRGALLLAIAAVLARETALPWLVVCAALVASEQRQHKARAIAVSASLASGLGVLLVLTSTRLRALLAFSFSDPAAYNRLGLQWAALPRGLLLFFGEPASFGVDMEFEPQGLARLVYLLTAVALYAIAGWLALRPRSPYVLRVSALLWLCLVLPLHSVVPKLDPLTARSTSASSAALLLVLACLALPIAQHARARLPVWLAAVGVLALLVMTTRGRAELYDDPIALWRDAALRSRHHTRPLLNLGTLLAQDGQLAEARSIFLQALRRNPHGTDERERLSAIDVLIGTHRLLTEPKLEDPPHQDRKR